MPVAPAQPALTAGKSLSVAGSGELNRDVAVRAAPRSDARRITVLRQFRRDYRPQVVLALSQRTDVESGTPTWYRISVPGRPNGRTGWIPADAADLRPVHEFIHIDRGARTLELWSKGRLALKTRVAVGRPGMETPLGLFYVTWKVVPRAPVLGKFAFETSAYSKLSEWPGGGIVAIHGTPEPQLLGQAVSHGCVRVANRDILRLRTLVALGTPIRIVA
ncbi:MAG: L,D-transpeptidase [Actinobacteria bacterium]|nr:L,D-transpeptidase [Actinomycetota bacterium]